MEAAKLLFDGKSEGANGRQAPLFPGSEPLAGRRERPRRPASSLRQRLACEANLVTLFKTGGLLCLDFHVDESIAIFSLRKINPAVAGLSMVIAALLLLGAIIALHLVTSNNLNLGLISLFTIAFALTIHLLTTARRAELFASTAACVLPRNEGCY